MRKASSPAGLAVTAMLVVVAVTLAVIGFRVVTRAAPPPTAPAAHQWTVATSSPTVADQPPSASAEASAASASGASRRTAQPSASHPAEPQQPAASSEPRPTKGPGLVIEELAVSAPIRMVGDARGELSLPADPWVVGQWSRGASLGDDTGTVLLAGHVSVGRQAGVGQHWGDLQPGAVISTVDEQGREQQWRAVQLRVYRGTDLPEDLFSRGGAHRLALVTCTGPVVQVDGRREYRDNLVIIAEPVVADR